MPQLGILFIINVHNLASQNAAISFIFNGKSAQVHITYTHTQLNTCTNIFVDMYVHFRFAKWNGKAILTT